MMKRTGMSIRLIWSGLSVAFVMLAGCQAYPTRPWTSNRELVQTGKEHRSTPITTPAKAKLLIDGLAWTLEDARTDKATASRVFNEVTFYGTFVAVAGIAFDSIAARNIGAGVAGSSSLIGGHYHFDNQEAALARASASAACLQQAMSAITLSDRGLFTDNFDDPKLLAAYDAIAPNTVSAVSAIGRQLDSDLRAINMTTAGIDVINKAAQSYQNAVDEAAKNPPGPTPKTDNQLKAANLALTNERARGDRNVRGHVVRDAPNPYTISQLDGEIGELQARANDEADARRAFSAGVQVYGKAANLCAALGSSK